ncbi:SIMPL domain-containing protein [Streptomyces profundus]|uniref:SIMPL domain-containing protein n=1 Tax=Streptomyces profundus TaxID=2867410 RepID=UPI001D162312|nr:SIMPL domain-containing protein [Streptomyces sp. MA3_2.13]UED84262.1 SIMPL domain-containing protein [Streptomyces sp. MA3_2.13]
MTEPSTSSKAAARSTSPQVAVRGEARLEVDPETARIGITVGARGSDRRAALNDLTRRNNAALELLKSYGEAVEKIETGAFAITPELRSGRTERVRAYYGKVHLQAVVADFTALGELTTRLADLELTSVSGPWWGLRPDSPVHRRTRQQAVRQAVERAREYAEALGAELVGLIDLADPGAEALPEMAPASFGGTRGAAAPGAASGQPPALDLEPRRQTVYARVNARFTITAPIL